MGIKLSGVSRNDLFIVSKVWNNQKESAKSIETACRHSLQALQLDYLDLYLIHWPLKRLGSDPTDHTQTLEELLEDWRGMENLVDVGLVKHIGFSNFTLKMVEFIWDQSRVKPSCNQIELNPLLPQHDMVKFCIRRDIKLVAYSPLASRNRDLLIRDPIVTKIAEQLKCTSSQVILAWAISKGICVIPKSTNPVRLKENLESAAILLSQDQIHLIDGLSSIHGEKRLFFNPDLNNPTGLNVFA